MRNNEIKNEIDEIRRKDLTYETKKYTYDFQQHEALRSFGENTYSSKINIDEAEIDQAIYYKIQQNLILNLDQEQQKLKIKKQNTDGNAYALYKSRESILNAFKSGIFPIKETQGKELKILTSKQMLQRLTIALVQIKAGNTCESLLNEIRLKKKINILLYQFLAFTIHGKM